jgi:hypothetical protein
MHDKSAVERLANPFGDPWAEKGPPNRSIPIGTSTMYRLYDAIDGVEPRVTKEGGFDLRMEEAEKHFLANSNHPFHYDESIAHLRTEMPAFRAVKARFESYGIHKTFIGYTFINVVDDKHFLGVTPKLKEEWFVHKAGCEPTPENRVVVVNDGSIERDGYLMDTTNAGFARFMADAIVQAMVHNGVDAVLIDFMGHMYPLGYYQHRDVLPIEFLENYREGQRRCLKIIARAAQAQGKMVFCNGIGLDGLYEQSYHDILRLTQACDGVFWEQPFRDEWREVGEFDSTVYYTRLRDFFELSKLTGKYVLIKQGTYRYSGDEKAVPGWKARFDITSAEQERRLARYLLSFYLLFTCGERTPMIYTHPVKVFDIFSSEAYFREWDTPIGAPLGDYIRYTKHIYSRRFENGLVICNNSIHAYGRKLDTPYRNLDGELVTRISMPGKTGLILLKA